MYASCHELQTLPKGISAVDRQNWNIQYKMSTRKFNVDEALDQIAYLSIILDKKTKKWNYIEN